MTLSGDLAGELAAKAALETESAEEEPPLEGSCASFETALWQVHSPVKGVLTLVHGLGEHSGRYCAVVKALTAAGYAVYAFDNQGHGKSAGQRGHIDRWQNYRDNIRAFLQLVREQEPSAPLFLMGHSLGGLIVLDYVLRSAQSAEFQRLNLLGIIVSAPPIQPMQGAASSVRIMLARLLSGLFPRLTLQMGLDKSGLSRKQEIADEIADDPLIHSCVTLRWGSETLNTIEWVKAHIDQLFLPILITHGDADPIIAPDGSRKIFQQIQSPAKTLTLYPGSYHEPHNDLDADVVVTDLVNWLNEYSHS
jgi:alpha-beta hydrolase superfamily lysophospholipase